MIFELQEVTFSHHANGAAELVPRMPGEQGFVWPTSDAFDDTAAPSIETPDLSPFICANPEKLAHLRSTFIDLASADVPGDLDVATLEHLIKEGSGLRLLLWEIEDLSPPRRADIERAHARSAYVKTLVKPSKKLWEHGKQNKVEETAREEYVDHVMARITEVIDGYTPHDALEARQMPSLVRTASFRDDTPLSMRDFAANHLYVLIDTVLKEKVAINHQIGDYQQRNLFARASSNRLVRISGGVLAAAAVAFPKLGVIPENNEVLTEEIEVGLKILSSGIFFIEGPEIVWGGLRSHRHRRRIEELRETLSKDRDLADHVLGMAYNSTRIGGAKDVGPIHQRYATDDPEENRALFRRFDEVFEHLNNDPGGKPYSGDQVLLYAGRLLVDREEQLRSILDPTVDAAARRERYLVLCREIIEEDLQRLRKDRIESRYRRFVVNIAMLPVAFLFNSGLSIGSEMKTVGTDTVHAIDHEAHPED